MGVLYILSDYIHSATVEVDGKQVYKATIARSLFKATPLSKDPLRKVEGISKTIVQGEQLQFDDSFVHVGDPVMVKPSKELPYLANIKTIKQSLKNIKAIHSSCIGVEGTTLLLIQAIELTTHESHPDKLIWTGRYLSDTVRSINGHYCMCIKPDILMNPLMVLLCLASILQ